MRAMTRAMSRTTASLAGILTVCVATSVGGFSLAAGTPSEINYQGILRDSSGLPLDGLHDMVFRFFDAETAGNEILVDAHEAVTANPVIVSGGMFNAALGGGTLADGLGPGVYTSLDAVLADHPDLWLAVQVNGEILAPRVRLLAAGYALNAASLQGKQALDFIDTSSTTQAKNGPLEILSLDADTKLTLSGGNWDTSSTEGDFKIGNDTHRFKIGVATDGGGAGDVRLQAVGGTDRMLIGAGNQDVLTVKGTGQVGINTISPLAALHVAGNGRFDSNLSALGGLSIDKGASPFAIDFLGSGVITAGPAFLSITAGRDDTDVLTLLAGNSFDDGSIQMFGGGGIHVNSNVDIKLVSGGDVNFETGGALQFKDSLAAVYGTLDPSGLDLAGGFLGLAGASFTASAAGLNISPGGGSGGDLFMMKDIHLGLPSWASTISSGLGADNIELTATSGKFLFNHGAASTTLAEIDPATGLTVAGALTLGGDFSFRTTGSFKDAVIKRGGLASWFFIQNDTGRSQMRLLDGANAAADFDGAVNANGLDYAETFRITDPTLEAGELVVLDPAAPGFIQRSAGARAPGLLGVISEAPGFVTGNSFDAEEQADPQVAALRSEARLAGDHDLVRQYTQQLMARKNEQSRPVALMGRVPVKVDGLYGVIRPGDPLTSSPTPGHAMGGEGDVVSGAPKTLSGAAPDVLLGAGLARIAGVDADLAADLKEARFRGDAREEARVWNEMHDLFARTHAAVALTGTVPCKVDAGYGAIRPGDMLVTSSTPGHAMRAGEDPAPGTIFAKALEPLRSGTGTIRVMVWRR